MEKHSKHTVCRNMAGISAASVAGFLFMASPAHEALGADNPFVQQFGADNPLHAPVLVDHYSKPALVDIDGDGDMDLFVGSYYEAIAYYENTGTADSPAFTQRTGTANPLDGVYVGNETSMYGGMINTPSFVDIDGDGDHDAFIGSYDGTIYAFENTGSSTAPAFVERTGLENPFNYECGTSYYSYDVGNSSAPAFADLDDDGDMDAAIGTGEGKIDYFKNTGTASAPAFAYYPWDTAGNPFSDLDVGDSATPAFVDLDNDGDLDVAAGEGAGGLHYLENTGTETAPAFTSYASGDTENPFYDMDFENNSAPAFVDLDGDGDMDAVVGQSNGKLAFVDNLGDAMAPAFYAAQGTDNPFGGFIVGFASKPVFVDIDGDGDLDMFTGEEEHDLDDTLEEVDYVDGSIIHFFENVGTATVLAFAKAAEENNPLAVATPAPDFSFVAFADIDGDGDQDAFGGAEDSPAINFYENTGTASAPAFELKGDGANPLFFIDQEDNTALCFVDIDGDGDMDAFIGGKGGYDNRYARIRFYKNTGDEENPRFAPATAQNNPLHFVFGDNTRGACYSLAFGDVDGDGDMDVVVGEDICCVSAGLKFYENAGTATDPAFAPVATVNDMFAKMAEGLDYDYLAPAFVDIDGDGDLDVFMGEDYGRFLYFENQGADDGGNGGTPAAAATDDDTCFIETVTPSADRGNLLTRAMKQAWLAVTAVLR